MPEETPEPTEVATEVAVVKPSLLAEMEIALIDRQIATAKKYPMHTTKEQIELFVAKVTTMATIDEEVAASCHYRRPVGKKGNQVEYAEGESVRLAELAVASYGNLKIQTFITSMEPKLVKAIARVHDMENNIAIEVEVSESTVTKGGQPYSYNMRLVVGKAAQKKAFRDAAFTVIPKALLKPAIKAAAIVASGGELPIAERRSRVAAWIVDLGILPERVFKALGVERLSDFEDEHFETLFGIRTAIRDGECSVADAFPGAAPETTKTGMEGAKEAMKGKKGPAEEPKDEAYPPKDAARVNQDTTDDDGGKEAPKGEKDADPTSAQTADPQKPSSSKSRQGAGQETANSDATPAENGQTGQGTPEPQTKYICTKCGKMDIIVKNVRGKDVQFCTKCLTGKNVVPVK